MVSPENKMHGARPERYLARLKQIDASCMKKNKCRIVAVTDKIAERHMQTAF